MINKLIQKIEQIVKPKTLAEVFAEKKPIISFLECDCDDGFMNKDNPCDKCNFHSITARSFLTKREK